MDCTLHHLHHSLRLFATVGAADGVVRTDWNSGHCALCDIDCARVVSSYAWCNMARDLAASATL